MKKKESELRTRYAEAVKLLRAERVMSAQWIEAREHLKKIEKEMESFFFANNIDKQARKRK